MRVEGLGLRGVGGFRGYRGFGVQGTGRVFRGFRFEESAVGFQGFGSGGYMMKMPVSVNTTPSTCPRHLKLSQLGTST